MVAGTKECRNGGFWNLLNAGGIVLLTAECKEEAVEMFKRWKNRMENGRLKITKQNKTKGDWQGSKEEVLQGKWSFMLCR